MYVNRLILKKSRHIGIGLLKFNPSTTAAQKILNLLLENFTAVARTVHHAVHT
jgi:hypothetical protein